MGIFRNIMYYSFVFVDLNKLYIYIYIVEMSHRTPHSQKYLLCNVYKKTGEIVAEIDAFIDEFSTLLQRVKNLNKLSYICRDYNIDLLKVKVNPRFGKFFD